MYWIFATHTNVGVKTVSDNTELIKVINEYVCSALFPLLHRTDRGKHTCLSI